jgi:murein DD-endopeptidase MepM/ murein hydrolase activator NlpD
LAQHRSAVSPPGVSGLSATARNRVPASVTRLPAVETTDIIPFNEFGDLADLEFCVNSAFDRETQVMRAPELCDLNDCEEEIPFQLAVPSQFRPEARDEFRTATSRGARNSTHAYRDSHTDVSDGNAATDIIAIGGRRASHRKPEAGAIRSRLMIAAMAAGATAAGAHSLINTDDTAATETVLASGETAMNASMVTGSVGGMQIVSVASAANQAVHTEEIQKAAAFAQERAEREARQMRPQFAMPTKGVWTSGFGYRWGVLHGGIDIANSIGTPIYAAADGVVIDTGPTAGYGAWVKLRHADGTVTLYGHINSWTVSVGERVMAGDQIATMGNRGNSTGPHLHFEVMMDGTDRVDPTSWLAKRGLSPGSYVG